ncbi:hypothetical protein [Saccharopolyspora hattusasensis]|uniref:hypothetical protein n=1 Tax=Saccharopolyspora hattusasensis TaxID=1128679 RepID=UPI003D95FC27
MSTKASERAALLRDVSVASTGESFAEWRERMVDQAPPLSDVQVARLLRLFTEGAHESSPSEVPSVIDPVAAQRPDRVRAV